MWNLPETEFPAARRRRGTYRALGWCAALAVVLAALATGCRDKQAEAQRAAAGPLAVQIVKPQLRTIACPVDQPGFVEAFEQTSIFAKVSGFIKHFDADIGQEVKRGELLAEIFVPELDEDHQQKVAQVELDQRMVEQARQLVAVAESQVRAAAAHLAESRANVGKFQADVARWDSELKRLTQMVQAKVVNQQVLAETQKQYVSSVAAQDAAQAAVTALEADLATSKATLEKTKIDVETARAKVRVSEADERKAAALLAYTKVTAPYDGVVTVRNANTGDYVQAASGDKSTANPSAIFVVARIDMLRIFIDVPEAYAHHVQKGTKAVVRAEALSGLEIPAAVARTSWAIRERTRTLRAEIDLTVKEYNGLRPGMYVRARVLVQRAQVHALPQQALTVAGNQTYCYLLRSEKAVKTPVEPGLGDGAWTEVAKMKIDDRWRIVSGDERVILADLSELTDGQEVAVAQTAAP